MPTVWELTLQPLLWYSDVFWQCLSFVELKNEIQLLGHHHYNLPKLRKSTENEWKKSARKRNTKTVQRETDGIFLKSNDIIFSEEKGRQWYVVLFSKMKIRQRLEVPDWNTISVWISVALCRRQHKSPTAYLFIIRTSWQYNSSTSLFHENTSATLIQQRFHPATNI